MKVEFILGTGFANAIHKEIVDLPDDYSGEDIEDIYQEWANEFLDKSWSILGDDDERDS